MLSAHGTPYGPLELGGVDLVEIWRRSAIGCLKKRPHCAVVFARRPPRQSPKLAVHEMRECKRQTESKPRKQDGHVVSSSIVPAVSATARSASCFAHGNTPSRLAVRKAARCIVAAIGVLSRAIGVLSRAVRVAWPLSVLKLATCMLQTSPFSVSVFHYRRVVCACSAGTVGSFSNKPLSPNFTQGRTDGISELNEVYVYRGQTGLLLTLVRPETRAGARARHGLL